MNRREFVAETGAALFSSRLLQLRAEPYPESPSPIEPYSSEMPDMLVSYLAKELNNLAEAWNKKRALVKTSSEVEARNRFVREMFLKMLHGFPERNPLNPRTVKILQKNGYRIENVMFQSRADFWVTANLYIPTADRGPFPGIISPCGHYPLARMVPQYQCAYLNLVKNGFVVLAYDPIGEGERRQYWNPETNLTAVGGPVYEHSMPGQLLWLLGENLTQYLVWDGMRAVDYLLTRPEVDPERIGCAGHSGGGTLTTFISVADDRVRCAANIEGGITNRWPVKIAPWEPIGPSDIEQNLFPAALYGVDGVDLSSAIAPRPLLAAVEHYSSDFDRAAQAIHSRYRQLGAPEKFATVSSDDPHAWTVKLRLATTDWFCRWFYNRRGPASEPQFELETPESLYCTPDGSIRYSHEGQTIFSLILKKQAKLPAERPIPRNSAQLKADATDIRDKIRQLLRYKKSNQPLDARSVVTTPRKGYRIEKIQFLSEPGIYIPAWVFVPERGAQDSAVILYVSDEGIETDGMEFEGAEESGLNPGVLDTLARKGNLVIAVDVRGIGETRPLHSSRSSATGVFRQLFDVETALSYMAWFMDQSLLGMRVQDVLRSVDYVVSRADADNKPLHVIGRGRGGLWCLYAALLDARVRSLICVRSLLSYRSLAEADRYVYGADVFIPDVLLQLDLPQVAGAMASRPLALVLPTDAMKNVVEVGVARETYRWALGAYESAGSGNLFRIESKASGLETPEHYLDLIRAFQSGS